MANEKEERIPGLLRRGGRTEKTDSTELSMDPTRVPFAVLLPPAGDLADLAQLKPSLDKKLERITGKKSSATGDNLSTAEASEETMLNQVIQWLKLTND